MTVNRTDTFEQWLKARRKLLDAEKALTRQMDEVNRQRMALPWVAVDQAYEFDTETGRQSLKDLFAGRSQLIIYHFMFGPTYAAGCPSCSAIADGFDGVITHLRNHDVAFWAVSRAVLPKLLAYRERMGWRFPWASASDSSFNFDFGVSFTAEQQRDGLTYNFQQEQPVANEASARTAIPGSNKREGGATKGAAAAETDLASYTRERPGMSAFALEDGVVYHTYSAYGRGLDAIWTTYRWLDRAPLGRNEPAYWWKRHDEY